MARKGLENIVLALVLFLAVVSQAKSFECSGIDFVSRSSWGARAATSRTNLVNPVPRVFIHHSATPGCNSRSTCIARTKSFQNYHMDTQKWADIGYNFLVGGDGSVYEGRGWSNMGAHVKGYNNVSIGICLIGNFMNETPNDKMLKAAQKLIDCGVKQGKISSNYKLHGHRDGGCTSCPGDKLYEIIQRWPKYTTSGVSKKC